MQDVQFNGNRQPAQLNRHTVPAGTGMGLGAAAEYPQDEYMLSVRDPLGVIWRRLWMIALVAIVFMGIALVYSFTQTPIYEAYIKVLVVGQSPNNVSYVPNPSQPAPNASERAVAFQSEVQGLGGIVETVVQAITTNPVAEATVQRLGSEKGADEVLGNLRANRLEETQFIEVFYRDPDPVEAQRVINAMGEVLPDEVQAVSPSTDAVAISLWDEASLPSTPVSPDPIRNGGLGLLLGGVLGVCLAFLLERLDKRRCRSPEQVERVSGAPVYAMIPRFKTPGVPGDDTK